MKTTQPTDLGGALVRFFQDYLPRQRGLSAHTVRSYRDALVLLLKFAARHTRKGIERLQISDLNAKCIKAFLNFLEVERHNAVATRNARLAAIHIFARYLATDQPQRLGELQQVLAIEFKRGARITPMAYLETAELDALLRSIDRSRPKGKRDYALFALMFNTGGRVQEILDLRRSDLRLDSPCQVRLAGKGNKTRLCPIWPATATVLRQFLDQRRRTVSDPSEDGPLFTNAWGRPLTRFGVRYLLRTYLADCSQSVDTLRDKSIHPHSIRHSTAICMLKSGVDFATISQWLGHASLNTTMRYARADIDLKRQALQQVFPDALAPPPGGRLRISGAELVAWLRGL
jgi:site-specific recombinase XerD